jgi:hypothetical protein
VTDDDVGPTAGVLGAVGPDDWLAGAWKLCGHDLSLSALA